MKHLVKLNLYQNTINKLRPFEGEVFYKNIDEEFAVKKIKLG